MRVKRWAVRWILLALLAVPGLALSQAVQRSWILVVSGQSGEAPVIQVGGRSYFDVEALARLTNGSLSFQGNQITLTLPASASSPSATESPTPPAADFSKDFMKAAIEVMSVIREWRSALVNAVQNGYPLTDDLVAGYRAEAAKNLRLASVAASTDSDHNTYQLISNELDKMQELSNKLLAARQNLNYIPRDALKDDPLDQQILACARSLAAIAASGQFQDDGSCH